MTKSHPFWFAAILAAGFLISTDGRAQPQGDVRLETYKFLLGEANERVVQANGQIAALQAEVAKLKADLEKGKKD
jgi:hypothetical protein